MFDRSEVEVILSALSFHESACIEMMKKANRPSDSYDCWSGRLSQNKAIAKKLNIDWQCQECDHLNHWMASKCNFCDASKPNA